MESKAGIPARRFQTPGRDARCTEWRVRRASLPADFRHREGMPGVQNGE
jgi:hypothetical protein